LYDSFGFDGMYFALPDDRSMNGGDFDHCLNGTAIKDIQVAAWIRSQNTYTEISPGGEGLRTIGIGAKPGDECRKGTEIELYDHARFLSITGHRFADTPETVNENADAVGRLYYEIWPEKEGPLARDNPPLVPVAGHHRFGELTPGDERLKKILLKDGKMRELYKSKSLTITWFDKEQKTQVSYVYASDSEADKALVAKLAWWTNGDPERTRRLAFDSDRARLKWHDLREGHAWIDREIEDSCETVQGGYQDADIIDFLDENGKVRVDLLVHDILERERFLTFISENPRSDRFDMNHYDGQIFRPAGRSFIEQEVERLAKHKATTGIARETVEKISRSTRAHREETDTKAPLELIPLRDAVYNLNTGQFEDYTPEVPLFVRHPGMYNPELLLEDSIGKRVLEEIFPSRVALDPEDKRENDLAIIQEFAGSCFYRDCLFKKALLLLGDGDNGKSLLLSMLEWAVGSENISHRTLQTLSNNRFASASLYHKTANIQADIGADLIRGTGTFKTITGGDSVDAEIKLGVAFSFVNTATCIYSANELSELARPDPVFYERFVLVEMIRRFVENPNPEAQNEFKRDAFLKDKLNNQREIDWFTTFSIEGLKRLLAQGHYTETSSAHDVMARWVNLTNSLLAFVHSDNVHHTPGIDVVKTLFYEAYTKWCYKNQMAPISQEYVGRMLPGMIETRTKQTKPHTWTGIAVKGVPAYDGPQPKNEEALPNIVETVPDGQKRLGDD
jgi:P4 family phage/plasmid primase-like protien